MNKIQWFVLSIGLIIFGSYLLSMSAPVCFGNDCLLVACYIREYAYAIPGLIFIALGIIFFILGLLEPKKK